MTKQEKIIAAIHAAIGASGSESIPLVSVYGALRTECEHYHNGTCTINPKNDSCSFSKCPYTNI